MHKIAFHFFISFFISIFLTFIILINITYFSRLPHHQHYSLIFTDHRFHLRRFINFISFFVSCEIFVFVSLRFFAPISADRDSKDKDKDKPGNNQLAVPRLSVCADAQKVDRAKLAQTEFNIIEFDPDTFRVLLDYLHTGTCPLTCVSIPGKHPKNVSS